MNKTEENLDTVKTGFRIVSEMCLRNIVFYDPNTRSEYEQGAINAYRRVIDYMQSVQKAGAEVIKLADKVNKE